METKSHNALVGLFVLAGLLAFGIIATWLNGRHADYAVYQSTFSGPVAGLASGINVRYNGIDVGHVSKVDFDPADPKGVVALFELRPDLPIRDDAVATIESEGLTGGSYVEIDGGNPDAPRIAPTREPPYPAIPSRVSYFQQFKQDLPRLLSALNKTAERSADLLNQENRQAVAKTLANLTTASARLEQMLASGDKAARRVEDVAGKIGELSQDVDSAVEESKTELKGGMAQFNQTLASIDLAAKRVDRLGANVDVAVDSFHTEIKDGIGQLTQFLGESRSLIERLARLTDDIQRQPTQLLFGDQRRGYQPK
jgi:phospholipid/cholesterol/gamma-HCH transport system substrate-binding protein